MITFKIDTGANVTMVLQETYRETQDGPLQFTKCKLAGAGGQPLDVQGHFKEYLKHTNTEMEQDTFIIIRLGKPLLKRPAIKALAMVALM